MSKWITEGFFFWRGRNKKVVPLGLVNTRYSRDFWPAIFCSSSTRMSTDSGPWATRRVRSPGLTRPRWAVDSCRSTTGPCSRWRSSCSVTWCRCSSFAASTFRCCSDCGSPRPRSVPRARGVAKGSRDSYSSLLEFLPSAGVPYRFELFFLFNSRLKLIEVFNYLEITR